MAHNTPNPLATYAEQLLRSRHRGLVLLEGSPQSARAWLARQDASDFALVSENPPDVSGTVIAPKHFQRYLGQEFGSLIWDTFSGIHPNAFAALSGTIKAGGQLIVLLPGSVARQSMRNQDNLRICRQDEPLHHTHRHFLTRLFRYLEAFEGGLRLPISHAPNLPPHLATAAGRADFLPTPNQQGVADAILTHHTADTVSHPCVVTADRGRGKSATLGLIAARWISEAGGVVRVTAPHQQSVTALFDTYQQCGGDLAYLVFHPPDQLLREQPECSLLLIDEAAAIAAPLLDALVAHYDHCVLASTVHGYEGSGRGFELRFGKSLATRYPQRLHLRLHTPIRWGPQDPLEEMINALFCLKPSEQAPLKDSTQAEIKRHTAHDLAHNDALLSQIMAILVSAHYQTRPDDLRFILDHPDAFIMTAENAGQVIAAALLVREGDMHDAALSDAIIAGTRRPRGQLVPQMLAHAASNRHWLQWQSWRVMRIAVQTGLQGRGIGSRLLHAIIAAAKEEKVAYLSSSFGLQDKLLRFWTRQQFKPVHLGYHLDAASNAYALIVLVPLCKPAQEASLQRQAELAAQLQCAPQLHPFLNTATTTALQQSLPAAGEAVDAQHWHQIYLAAHHKRSVSDTTALVFRALQRPPGKQALQQLATQHKDLLQATFVDGKPAPQLITQFVLPGKKGLEQAQRDSLAAWLRCLKDANLLPT